MSNNAHIKLVITTKELVKTFYEVVFGVNWCCRMQLAVLVGICLQSFLQIIIDGVGVVDVELRFWRIGITTTGSIKESA